MRVFLGHDPREQAAYNVAERTLWGSSGLLAEPLCEERLRAHGLLWRPVDRRGRMHDLVSGADQSTEFAISRFLVPMLCQHGSALFADCDVVFLRDVHELLERDDYTSKAVYVVKHDHRPRETLKMHGQTQYSYSRKNWSSVVLWNCDHPAHRRLNLYCVNNMPGRWLHSFAWLHDEEIGELPAEWNWLVGVQPKPEKAAIAHFTLGGPWLSGWAGAEHDDIWTRAAQ
jgi:lipopolysaccharide biosynthesis glycosyltransferase